jgi:hypothetical protein
VSVSSSRATGPASATTFHDLRHTFGTRMAAVGVPLRFIQEWMGHSNAQTTEIYADYAPDPTQGAKCAEAAFGTGVAANSGGAGSAQEEPRGAVRPPPEPAP